MLTDLMTAHPEDFPRSESATSQWTRAQHFTLPTRLLDITDNPLVALFFACGESDDKYRKEDGRVDLFVVNDANATEAGCHGAASDSSKYRIMRTFNSDTLAAIANFAKLNNSDRDHITCRALTCMGRGRNMERPKVEEEGDEDRAVKKLFHSIADEKPAYTSGIFPEHFFGVYVVIPQQSDERVRSQGGAFLISAYHEYFEEEMVHERIDHLLEENSAKCLPKLDQGLINLKLEIKHRYQHKTLTVPWKKKRKIRRLLSDLSVSRDTLFPGLESSAKTISIWYKKK